MSNELVPLKERAQYLVAQNLRSKAALIERLQPLIDQVHAFGHAHIRIHEVLLAEGVDMNFQVYMTTLKRVRRRARLTQSALSEGVDVDFSSMSGGDLLANPKRERPDDMWRTESKHNKQ